MVTPPCPAWGLGSLAWARVRCSGDRPPGRLRRDHLAEPGDRLWATSGNNSRYYLETGLLSPTRYLFVYAHVFVDTWRDSGEQKLAALRADLERAPPRFVVVVVADDDSGFLEQTALLEWIAAEYVATGISDIDVNARGGRARLWVRR